MKETNEQPQDSTVANGGIEPTDTSTDDTAESERTESDTPNGEITEIAPEAKQEFLLEAIRRAPLLRLLQSQSADASDLSKSVDMSRSTVHRALKSLEEHDIIIESDCEYELTSLGEIIAEKTERFGTQTWTAVSLKQFLNSVDMNGNSIPVKHFTGANVTRRKSRQPHATIHRIIELIESSDTLQMFSTVISPVYVDVGYREMMDGMKIEAIFDREVVDIMLSEYPEKAQETVSTGNFEVYAHDGLPFEMFLFDDKVGIAAHNENGNAEVLVECNDPSAIEWAENLYAKHLSKAEPLMISDS